MVKISFQPAVAGIKGDKADKASASASAPAPPAAAEILLTPARVRGAGGLRRGVGDRGAPRRPGTARGASGPWSREGGRGGSLKWVIHPKVERRLRSCPKSGSRKRKSEEWEGVRVAGPQVGKRSRSLQKVEGVLGAGPKTGGGGWSEEV